MLPHTLIVDDVGHALLADKLSTISELALDTESNSMFAYRERLCLVQIAIPRGDGADLFVIDPLCFPDVRHALGPLVPWLVTPGNRVLLHGGEYDVAIFKRELDLAPHRVFDTQAAATMLGLERTGFGSLVEAFCDVTLKKSHQQHDWKRRPIPSDALAYALDDVVWLLPLARHIEAIVADADLVDEVEIACAAVADARPHAPRDTADAFARAARGTAFDAAGMAILYALFGWREQVAEERDVPPARLIPNEVLHRLTARRPTTVSELAGIGLARDVLQKKADELLAVIAGAITNPPALPAKPPRGRPDSLVKQREGRLKDWRETEARRRGVSTQAVLPARALDHLATLGASGLATAPQLGDKRLALYADKLARLLA